MEKFIQKNKFILTLLSLVICLSLAYGLTVKLDPEANAAVSKVSATNYSWSSIAQGAAQYLGTTASSSGNQGEGIATPDASTGFAGAMLGYMDPNDSDTNFSIAGINSGDTVSYSYNTLKKLNKFLKESSNSDAWSDSAMTYATFGYALTASGVDESYVVGQMSDDHRSLIGPVVLIVFLLCIAVPEFFKLVLTFLSVANPFRLFLGSDSILNSITPGISADANFDNKSSAITSTMSDALTTLQNTVTGLYNALYNLSFAAVIPIMIAIALFMWLVLRRPASSVFKNLIIRVVFIGLGVPLMLACYTAAIDSVKDFMINESTGTAVTVITSTFCDYGDFALGNFSTGLDYLRLPSGVTLKVNDENGTLSYDASSTSDRKLVQLINSTKGGFTVSTALSGDNTATGIAADDVKLVSSVSGTASEETVTAIINLLQSYTKGEYITAANLASKFNNVYVGTHAIEKQKIWNLSTNYRYYDPDFATDVTYNSAPDDQSTMTEQDVKNFAAQRFFDSSSIVSSSTCNPFFSSGTVGQGHSYDASSSSATHVGSNTVPFCRLAAYNFLSTQFSDTDLTVFSADATTSSQLQLAHYSVSIAGQGYMEVAYVFDAICIMACLMVLGYGYGFALLFACFKSLIQMFPKVLTGMIGSLKGIAGAVALTAALIIEIVGTCIVYALGSMFISIIYQVIEEPIATLLGSSALNLPGNAASLLTVAMSSVIMVTMTKKLLDYRKAIVVSVTEQATAFINKFVGTNVTAPNLESSMSAGDMASVGLGLAMVGASTPIGNKLADRTEGLTEKIADTAADKVASGSLAGSGRTGTYGEKYATADAADAAKKATSNDSHIATTSDSSGSLVMKSDNETSDYDDTPGMTDDEKAQAMVDSNTADFESSIGMTSTDTDTDTTSDLADHTDDLKNTTPQQRQKSKYADGSDMPESEESDDADSQNGSKKSKLTDNSETEIVGTKTKDVTGTEKDTTSDTEDDDKNRKLTVTDSQGNSQEVSIVNARTGKAYTQADKDAGENYQVIGKDGKSIYGNAVPDGMNSNTLYMENGQAKAMVMPGESGLGKEGNASGGGGVLRVDDTNTNQNVTQTVKQDVQTTSQSTAQQTIKQDTQATTQQTVHSDVNTSSSGSNVVSSTGTVNTVTEKATEVVRDSGSSSTGSANMAAPNVNVQVAAGDINQTGVSSTGQGSTPVVNVQASGTQAASSVINMTSDNSGNLGSTVINQAPDVIVANNSSMPQGSMSSGNSNATYVTQNVTQEVQNVANTKNTLNNSSYTMDQSVINQATSVSDGTRTSGSDRPRRGLGENLTGKGVLKR